jgi:hypothetical protein
MLEDILALYNLQFTYPALTNGYNIPLNSPGDTYSTTGRLAAYKLQAGDM